MFRVCTELCAKDLSLMFFGDIVNEEIKLSEIGIIADVLWHEINKERKQPAEYKRELTDCSKNLE